MATMLSAITWLYLYPLTSNSRSPEGKSHLKRSVDQKVVLQLHIVKLIILGSKYWGLHAHLSQSVLINWAHLCKMSIYPYENSFVSVASCSSSQQYFCAQISHSPNQTKLSLKSTWSKQASCWSVLTTSPLTRHHHFTQIPNYYFWSHASVQRRKGSGQIFLFERLQLLHSIQQQS